MIEFRTLGTLDLRRDDGSVLRSLVAAPKRLALLSYLVLARPHGFQRRDTLVALFWPEHDALHARGSLRNLLHMLRRALGNDVVLSRGDEEVGVAPDALWCDAVAFEEELESGNLVEALELYRGDLFDGFFLSGASEFEQWLEGERRRLRALAAEAAWTLAEREEKAGNRAAAVQLARRAAAFSPFDEVGLRRLLVLIEESGDRAGAVHAYEEFARRLAEELELDVAPETEALVVAIRSRDEVRGTGSSAATSSRDPAPGAAAAPPSVAADRTAASGSAPPRAGYGASLRAMPRARRTMLVAIPAALLLLALAAGFLSRIPEAPRPVMAIGRIHAHGDSASAHLAGPLADMLASHLSRIPELRVVSPARMTELMARVRMNGDTAAPAVRAARLGGIEDLIEGSLHSRADGTLRLDLRRVDLKSGTVRDAITVEDLDIFTLAARASAAFATRLRVPAPPPVDPRAPTRSAVAYRFYEEGLRAYYQGDAVAARSLLGTAVAEDSAFAMASYYLGLATPEHAPRLEHLNRALRHSIRASERDGLVIRAMWAFECWEPSLSVLADSLAARYPAEPEGHYLLGRARALQGDFLGAIPPLERVVSMDSLGLGLEGPSCRACDAFTEMINAYVYADSFAAAERVARRWVDLQPASARAWERLAWTLWRQDRFEEAVAARRTAASHRAGNAGDAVYPATAAVRAGDFAAADELLRERIRHGRPQVRTHALFWLTVSLRHQGRLREALATAREYRQTVAEGISDLNAGGPEAQVLLEMGRYREAAALFDSISAQPWSDLTPARNASRRLWGLTQVASARAAAGDVLTLGALADTMAALGQQSGLGLYRLLHHHPRGLLLSAQGRTEEAADELRRSIFSPVTNFPGPKLALARTLIEIDRPAEAVSVLQAALRGPTAGPGAYTTRTELHELLGHAWDAAAQPDSAAVHFRRVIIAWKDADPQYERRREAVRDRLALLDAPPSTQRRHTGSRATAPR